MKKVYKKAQLLVDSEKLEDLSRLIRENPDLKEFTYIDDNILHYVCYNKPAYLKEILAQGVNPDLSDSAGITMLMYFSSIGDIQQLNTLINAGANLNIESILGESALSFACNRGQYNCAKLLHKNGAKFDSNIKKDLCVFAMKSGNRDLINWLYNLKF